MTLESTPIYRHKLQDPIKGCKGPRLRINVDKIDPSKIYIALGPVFGVMDRAAAIELINAIADIVESGE